MKFKALIILAIIAAFMSFRNNNLEGNSKAGAFNIGKDLLLVQFDCRTDVDDIHSIAALATLMSDAAFSKVNYHVVAGTYGMQKGLYVPPNDLLELSFSGNWSDAHENFESAVKQVKEIVTGTLKKQGDIWIAEGGQSDFTAGLIKALATDFPGINVSKRIHVVQHSTWNEKMTSPKNLQFVKENTDYCKIPDGNAVGNGTPGFRSPDYTGWKDKISDPKLVKIWQLAIDIANKYNGKDGRHNNPAISAGGLDFSDLSEVCWILGLNEIKDTEGFFNLYSN